MTLCSAPVNHHEALIAGVVHWSTVHIHVLIKGPSAAEWMALSVTMQKYGCE